MKTLLSIALALTTLSTPALARDHYDRGYGRGDYGYVQAQRGYDRGYGYDRGRNYGRNDGYGRGGGRGYNNSCRGSNADGTIVGAVTGGVLGNVVAGRGDRQRGTIIGGLLGGVLGHSIDDSSGRCR